MRNVNGNFCSSGEFVALITCTKAEVNALCFPTWSRQCPCVQGINLKPPTPGRAQRRWWWEGVCLLDVGSSCRGFFIILLRKGLEWWGALDVACRESRGEGGDLPGLSWLNSHV